MFNRKGISPVIATLLLIVITVAAAVVTYTFTMGFVGTTTATTGVAQGQLSYDAFNVVGTTNSNITIYLRNTGGKAVVLNAVYVDGSLYIYNSTVTKAYVWENATHGLPRGQWAFFIGTTNTASLEVGQVGELCIASNTPAAQSQQVTIVCTDGTTLSLSVRK